MGPGQNADNEVVTAEIRHGARDPCPISTRILIRAAKLGNLE
jgi:hypothetical protein